MSARIDYYDDPAAPIATSLVPAANVVVINEAGEVVMIRRGDNANWAIPGGSMELGESLLDTARREVLEETGLRVKITGLVGLFTDPCHVIETDDAVRQEFSVVFTARRIAGTLTPSEEIPRGPLDGTGCDRQPADGPVDADTHRSLPHEKGGAIPWLDTPRRALPVVDLLGRAWPSPSSVASSPASSPTWR